MFLIENNSAFKVSYSADAIATLGDLIFNYKDKAIGLHFTGAVPSIKEDLLYQKYYCFGYINKIKCLIPKTNNIDVKDLHFIEVRTSYQLLTEELYQAAAIGRHIYHFQNTHRYCGHCSSLMADKQDELARICGKCSQIAYPKISPCVIVLIKRNKEILLARSPHFAPNVMSTLAGFVSIGESIEQTVIREVKEEVGIEIGNLCYICSQPWPFPDSLMLGFMADYVQGEIIIDHHEIEEAAWFSKDNLPLLPNKMSIARYLIDMHLDSITIR